MKEVYEVKLVVERQDNGVLRIEHHTLSSREILALSQDVFEDTTVHHAVQTVVGSVVRAVAAHYRKKEGGDVGK